MFDEVGATAVGANVVSIEVGACVGVGVTLPQISLNTLRVPPGVVSKATALSPSPHDCEADFVVLITSPNGPSTLPVTHSTSLSCEIVLPLNPFEAPQYPLSLKAVCAVPSFPPGSTVTRASPHVKLVISSIQSPDRRSN